MATFSKAIQDNLDLVFRAGGIGARRAQVYETCFGYNYRARGQVVPGQRDQVGLTFFTRPDLNLYRDNLTQDRNLTDLITPASISYARAVRAWLDPNGSANPDFDYSTPLVNPKAAFISLLTNTLKSLSGFPDNAMSKYTSQEGIMGEQWGMSDGPYQVRGNFQLTGSFVNIDGSPATRLFDVWGRYQENIRTKIMRPWSWNIYQNRMDYTTRIYRLILDPGRRFVQQIACTGYSFPLTNPTGGIFNFDADDNYDRSTDVISVQFDSYGAIYNDPIIIRAFNKVSAMFNSDLTIMNEANLASQDILIKGTGYYQVTPDQRELMNYYSYPLIHPYTRELCWYVEKTVYNQIMGANSATANYSFTPIPEDEDSDASYFSSLLDIQQGDLNV